MRRRARWRDFLVAFLAVGAAAFAARMLNSSGDLAAFFLVPFGLALVLGIARPSAIGSLGAFLGWTLGVALGWWIDDGDLWVDGPAVYALVAAFAPYAIGSGIRILLRPRAEPSAR